MTDFSDRTKLSRFISLLLRHHPEKVNLTLDEHGWADVDELLAGINSTGRLIDRALLEEIVASDEKQRYSFDERKELIRANQGHSIPVDVELEKAIPPDILYHGTAQKFADSIRREGIRRMSRLYVHLSKDMETALKVGRRHGKPLAFSVPAGKMSRDGIPFYISANGVWLTEYVGVEYLGEVIGQ
ncbi:MAG: RNA 2'-phosphotransferase [Lachnospiraceae bacterium]|nr:RNA 2'-phosphotransferase [Lachnospiraceae bacterium]